MPLATAHSISLFGLVGRAVEVETDISSNLPAFVLVGLPDASIQESASRVRAATTNSGLPLPGRRITVNLSPASVPKHGSSFDLAIAISALGAAGYFQTSQVRETAILGELALDGRIKPIIGALASAVSAKKLGFRKLFLPLANLHETKQLSGIEIIGFDHLTQAMSYLGAKVNPREFSTVVKPELEPQVSELCFSDVKGQQEAIEAMTLAAVGGHHLMMIGPPGAGKTMLASRLPGILPNLTESQSIEVGAITSLGRPENFRLSNEPPFQSPHHSATMVAMVGGGGTTPKPGLISLAHHGVLFLDEAPEFQSSVLEALRQPLESGEITISRAAGQAIFPARFQLVLAANPCPCGFAIGTGKDCTCNQANRARYLGKLSGPLSDRIDIRLELDSVNAATMLSTDESKTTTELKKRVAEARTQTADRLKKTPWEINSQLPGSYLRRELKLSKSVTQSLDRALDHKLISMRGYDRVLRLAWSLADLNGRGMPNVDDLSLATYYRQGDR